jgi:hypothetical protein
MFPYFVIRHAAGGIFSCIQFCKQFIFKPDVIFVQQQNGVQITSLQLTKYVEFNIFSSSYTGKILGKYLITFENRIYTLTRSLLSYCSFTYLDVVDPACRYIHTFSKTVLCPQKLSDCTSQLRWQKSKNSYSTTPQLHMTADIPQWPPNNAKTAKAVVREWLPPHRL